MADTQPILLLAAMVFAMALFAFLPAQAVPGSGSAFVLLAAMGWLGYVQRRWGIRRHG